MNAQSSLYSAPFTIQRLCELYTALGKYLRAVEKSLLVTSTWNTFPPSTTNGTATNGASLPAASPFATPSASALNTPLFSPIPFLHEDARRSASRSPPPSPLVLGAATGTLGAAPVQTDAGAIEPRALGLVDEMDAPGPGHMSEKPTALSSVTDVPVEGDAAVEEDKDVKMEANRASTPEPEETQRKAKKPLFSSLKDRFVASSEQKKEDANENENEQMDTEGDKQDTKA
jgi:serine/threonine-protein phosphatase 4 regulatory subunit 2